MGLNWSGGLSGAAGAGAMAGPWDAVIGGLAGLFGGGGDDDRQTQTMTPLLRDFSQGERRIISMIESKFPGLLDQMSPENRRQIAQEYSALAREQGMEAVDRTFKGIERQHTLGMARTGGSLGSIDLYAKGEIGRARSQASDEVSRGSLMFGEQVAGGRMSEYMNQANTFAGALSQVHGLRNIGAGYTATTTQNQNPMAAGMGMLGYGMMDEDSYLRGLID